jgi:hypothetical protein
MRITVTLPGEEVLSFAVNPSDTIRALKARIEESQGRRIYAWVLKFDDMPVSNDRTLEDYRIRDGDCLYFRQIVDGGDMQIGFQFNTLNKEVIKSLVPARAGEEHRIVTPGLSFRSKCLNQNCRVHNQVVYVNKGYSEGPEKFNIGLLSYRLTCPICDKKAERATNCGFFLVVLAKK